MTFPATAPDSWRSPNAKEHRLSCVSVYAKLYGFGRNAKRSVLIHLSFWIIGSVPLPSKEKRSLSLPFRSFSALRYHIDVQDANITRIWTTGVCLPFTEAILWKLIDGSVREDFFPIDYKDANCQILV